MGEEKAEGEEKWGEEKEGRRGRRRRGKGGGGEGGRGGGRGRREVIVGVETVILQDTLHDMGSGTYIL